MRIVTDFQFNSTFLAKYLFMPLLRVQFFWYFDKKATIALIPHTFKPTHTHTKHSFHIYWNHIQHLYPQIVKLCVLYHPFFPLIHYTRYFQMLHFFEEKKYSQYYSDKGFPENVIDVCKSLWTVQIFMLFMLWKDMKIYCNRNLFMYVCEWWIIWKQ